MRAVRVWLIVSALMLIPTLLYPFSGLLYIVILYFAWQKRQGVYISERWGSTYPRKSDDRRYEGR